jgi:3-hydroxyisobutyrate dehydrogenase-like beta-hydroxyacid dehydrogenase
MAELEFIGLGLMGLPLRSPYLNAATLTDIQNMQYHST